MEKDNTAVQATGEEAIKLLQVQVPASLIHRVRMAAAKENMAMSPWLRRLIESGVESAGVPRAS